ncbi:hypothetical protein Pst134EA_019167 [Puccinia striiformis f. sp. tritici]|nr:hypothetical protein Pst134EA_019167 [Puccinia striiformis f. sp. tritici]KAH9449267.1 hypothetical protein Pst134EB_020092 [Puccinia striiformis f. sp. tritici]KAH9459015.1 hypothetical protein Pst134EA_019167 [Puccinia striiformis f. sp. tritici]KNF05723.1 hypothetical protein, variant [Puccinia striiformis f. sp. tritici PST-78]
MYRNRKSVIIGRNQNPWQETNLSELKRQDIRIVRRRSGGGTVYHDEGNTNYSIMMSRERFDRSTNTRIVSRAIQEMGIPKVDITDRYDVCVNNQKVSGSAFRITSKRAYHHGTMLIDSNLDNLRGALRPTPNINIVDSKAVGSVRSPVTSLIKNSPPNDTQKEVNHVQFMNTLSREFSRHYYPDSDVCSSEPQVLDETELQSNPIIQTGYEELKSWNWIYGQTPQFTRRIEVKIDSQKNQIPVEVTYKNGVISGTKINLASYSSSLKQKISESFPIGKPIDF